MKACTTAGGGVMFIPDEIEQKTARRKEKVSYADISQEEVSVKPAKTFGRRKEEKSLRHAA